MTEAASEGFVRIRKVHLDYEGGDGMAKPMSLAFTSEADESTEDAATRARAIFTEQFPEWRLRSCQPAEETQVVERSSLQAIAGIEGVWLFV